MDNQVLRSGYHGHGAGVAELGGDMPVWADRELASDYPVTIQKRGIDVPFLLLTLIILMIGIVMVLSSSFTSAYYTFGEPMALFTRQLVFAVTGIVFMLLASRVQVETMRGWSMALLAASIVLLMVVPFIGVKVNGARRWMGVGSETNSFTFQPSEIAKLALIMSYSRMICKYGRKKMRSFRFGIAPFISIAALMVGLLVLEPHLSASVIIITLAVIMMFAGGAKLRWFMLAALIVALALMLFYFVFIAPPGAEGMGDAEQPQSNGSTFGYAGGRISAWLDPEADPLGDGFQIRQSLYAVGSGGLLGLGLGQSRQKLLYLPEEHNDYIFAIVCEELGFVGAMLILMLFALLIIRGFWIALHARDKYASLVATGISALLAIQVFLNVAVVTNLVPATGISLPFFSYGGTALWIQLVQMGIILAVSREIPLDTGEGGKQ